MKYNWIYDEQLPNIDDFLLSNEILNELKSKNIILTAKEIEVLKLVLLGYQNSDISRKLCITLHTVKKHLNNIYSKFYLDSYDNAIKRAKLIQLFLLFLLPKTNKRNKELSTKQ